VPLRESRMCAKISVEFLSGKIKNAAKQIGNFGETWEINEAKHRSNPWFATAAGSYLQAVNRIFVNPNENGDVEIAAFVPEKWGDFAFALPSHGGAFVSARAKNGKLESLLYKAGTDGQKRRLILPARLVDGAKIPAGAKVSGGKIVIDIDGDFAL